MRLKIDMISYQSWSIIDDTPFKCTLVLPIHDLRDYWKPEDWPTLDIQRKTASCDWKQTAIRTFWKVINKCRTYLWGVEVVLAKASWTLEVTSDAVLLVGSHCHTSQRMWLHRTEEHEHTDKMPQRIERHPRYRSIRAVQIFDKAQDQGGRLW